MIVGVTLAPAVLAYGAATGTATPASHRPPAKTAKTLTRAQELRKALAACKKDNAKAKRKSCETKAKRSYGAKHAQKTRKPGKTTSQPREVGGAGNGNAEAPTGGGDAAGGTEAEELQKAAMVGAPTAAAVEAGKKLFAEQCAGCHGAAGTGGDGGPNLNLMPRAHSVTGVIEQLIKPEGPMPSFDKGLSFQQKEELGNFVAVEITHAAQS